MVRASSGFSGLCVPTEHAWARNGDRPGPCDARVAFVHRALSRLRFGFVVALVALVAVDGQE